MHESVTKKISILLLVYTLIIFGYIFSLGFYYIPGLILLLVSFSSLLLLHKLDFERKIVTIDFYTLTTFTLILFAALSMSLYGGLYQNNSHGFISLSRVLLMISLLITFTYFVKVSKIQKFRWFFHLNFWLLIVIAFLLRLLMIWSSPSPHIDVFYIQKIAPIALIYGDNPYSILYPKLYPNEVPDVYSYGPAVILLDMPAVLLTGDPRYTMAFAEIGTALLMYLILRTSHKPKLRIDNEIQELLPLIFLYNPRSLFIIEQAWVDPLAIFLVTLFIFFLFSLRRKLLAFVIFGVVLATKQYSIFLIPFLMRSGYLKIRNLVLSSCVFLGFTLPFFIWNSADFLHDVVFYSLVYPPRHDSLSLNSLLYYITGVDIPPIIVIFLAFLFLMYLLKFQRKMPSAALLATATFSLSVFVFYKLAFIHYFYFSSSLLLISIVLLISEYLNKSYER